MRHLTTFENEQIARRFSNYLAARNIHHECESDGKGGWLLWIESDDDVEAARVELEAFRAAPQDARFNAPAPAAAKPAAKAGRHKEVDVRTTWGRGAGGDGLPGLLTGGLIVFAIGVFVLDFFPDLKPVRDLLFISNVFSSGFPGLPEVLSGQVWRLVTPIFLHFGLMHIFFNLYAVSLLGNMMEKVEGTVFVLVATLAIAVASNLAQYYISGPRFGGLSGVVYGYAGYVFLHSRTVRGSPYPVDPVMEILLVGWLALGFLGVIGNMANWAHLVGLLGGAAALAVGRAMGRGIRA